MDGAAPGSRRPCFCWLAPGFRRLARAVAGAPLLFQREAVATASCGAPSDTQAFWLTADWRLTNV